MKNPSTNRKRNRATATAARRILKRMWTSWKVKSCADGTFRIEPRWRAKMRRPGVLTRMYAAAMVEDVINGQ